MDVRVARVPVLVDAAIGPRLLGGRRADTSLATRSGGGGPTELRPGRHGRGSPRRHHIRHRCDYRGRRRRCGGAQSSYTSNPERIENLPEYVTMDSRALSWEQRHTPGFGRYSCCQPYARRHLLACSSQVCSSVASAVDLPSPSLMTPPVNGQDASAIPPTAGQIRQEDSNIGPPEVRVVAEVEPNTPSSTGGRQTSAPATRLGWAGPNPPPSPSSSRV